MTKKSLILLLVIYIASSVVSYAAFAAMSKSGSTGSDTSQTGTTKQADNTTPSSDETEVEDEETLIAIDPNAPKDAECPLNGKMYTQAEKEAWEKKRPLAVMIENHPDARPQSGLSQADVVFEALAEGGVTRFMGVFYCDAQRIDVPVAPVRSARTYFIDWASGYNRPLYAHVGGANVEGPANALGQLADYGWVGQNDITGLSVGYPTFVRDYNRVEGKELATEHTMVSSTDKLWKLGEKRGWTNMNPVVKVGRTSVPAADWKDGYQADEFQDDAAGKGSVNSVSFEFWDGFSQYGVNWQYDKATNSYKRNMAGEPHTDMNNTHQIATKNAVVLFTEEKGPIDDHHHMLYKTTGTGDALVFQNGAVIKAKWSKKTRESQLTFTDDKGNDLEFVRGQIWISVLDDGTKVTY